MMSKLALSGSIVLSYSISLAFVRGGVKLIKFVNHRDFEIELMNIPRA